MVEVARVSAVVKRAHIRALKARLREKNVWDSVNWIGRLDQEGPHATN